MAIVNRIPVLIAEKFRDEGKINLKQIQRETGMDYGVISRWVRGKVDRADFPILEAWCRYLHCTVGDILVYQSDSQDK